MDECRAPGPDHPGLSRNGYCERALHHQEELFVLVLMRGMRRTSRSQRRLVHFNVIAGMCQAVQDRPGLVLPICFTGNSSKGLVKELIVGLSEANAEEAASNGIACRTERRVAFIKISLVIEFL
jgi:hypothetical protein